MVGLDHDPHSKSPLVHSVVVVRSSGGPCLYLLGQVFGASFHMYSEDPAIDVYKSSRTEHVPHPQYAPITFASKYPRNGESGPTSFASRETSSASFRTFSTSSRKTPGSALVPQLRSSSSSTVPILDLDLMNGKGKMGLEYFARHLEDETKVRLNTECLVRACKIRWADIQSIHLGM